jgi:hypothetical protein
MARTARHLMREIDTRYECAEVGEVEELEVLLEDTLESLDAVLGAIDEDSDPGEDLEPDVDAEPDLGEGCSIEEQFGEAYERHLLFPQSFPRANLLECLRDVLISAQRGGMTPSGFRGADDEALLELAAELQEEYRGRIATLLTGSRGGATEAVVQFRRREHPDPRRDPAVVSRSPRLAAGRSSEVRVERVNTGR